VPILTSSQAFELFDSGSYRATFGGAEELLSEDGRPWLRWLWNITKLDGTIAQFSEGSSMKLSPKSKAYPWVTALLGRSIVLGEDVDLDALVGTDCQVLLTKEKLSNGEFRNRLAEVERAVAS
jgi:hypothetical protein